MKKIIFTVMLSLLILSPAYAKVSTGDVAPDFTLSDTQGNLHSLSDATGNYVVLEWVNPECPFVQKHYSGGNMQALQKEFVDQGVVWYSVASSAEGKQGHYSADEWQEIIQDKNYASTAVLLDASGEVGKSYAAKTTPHMYIVNPEGLLVYQGAIDDTPSADASDIAGSTNYVRQALNQALAGEDISEATTKPYGCSVKY